ncbi:aldo/keto reductase [Enterococcus pallens]|uniref:Oxidoreductase, aldo/keto reductase n=1 Tax=Enterococcus pallens ATCC BAA-351 TaxID=1158607 RepID=R2S4R9_9ENTE|nr:aldo/keto reductase [Enterococcus pallens]EOH87896.1 oxidoreductase, aldo/keto reductase [Enterococcus pallens ATCC BAA-351]EOU18110.1 oxidoreductase, aldo/keto reductase [Enterococcus pallens ATCC BAA-351]OJG82268.1 oxidoreductase, aldo/keto reductase [Enterococcus pallens]
MTDVRIGRSRVYSTDLGLGTNAVGGHNLFPDLDEEQGKAVVRSALDNGITLLDTAFAYGIGRSEELIGEVLQEPNYDRSRVIVATKAAQDVTKNDALNNSPEFLKQAVEDALKRLQTTYIDIFYIHFPDENTPKNKAIAALHELKEAGKIRAIGVSNFSLEQLQEANQDSYVDVVEDQYSLLHREAESELFPYLKEHRISFVPFFPLASGLLTGKYTKENDFDNSDIRNDNPDFKGERFRQILAKVDLLRPIAETYNATVAQLVLAWYMKNPAISAVIPGAKHPDQVETNAKAVDIRLSEADYIMIDNIFKDLN